jgi:dolichol-phosphate mannosyltransferase
VAVFQAQVAEKLPDAAFPPPTVSVVLAAMNEAGNIGPLIREISAQLRQLELSFEVIVVDGGSHDETRAQSEEAGARSILQRRIGYGGAVREGFLAARGDYILTLDADCSHPPSLIPELWRERERADVVIGSRFVFGGKSEAPLFRQVLPRILSRTFASLLSLPVRDSSSGYRLYRRTVLKPHSYRYENFNILQEILVKAFADGFNFAEVPLHYYPRRGGTSHVRLVKFCLSYISTLYRMWLLRHSPQAADYELHAYDSRHLLQRYWQRRRTRIVSEFVKGSASLLDAGCGSSKFTTLHPECLALDVRREKLRAIRPTNPRRVQADAQHLPFKNNGFDGLLLSEVIPYVEDTSSLIREAHRVLKDGGKLVLTIPDESRLSWKLIGFLYSRLLPNVRQSPQITRLTRAEVAELLAVNSFRISRYRYIAGAELVLLAERVS